MIGVSVVVQTVGRSYLLKNLTSINNQNYTGPIQILLGLDKDMFGEFDNVINQFNQIKKDNIELTIINPGYSTSERHGGPHKCRYGGSLRTVLSFLARYYYVTYLDDDDWVEPNHISELIKAIQYKHWAFTLCQYVTENDEIIGPDTKESVGPHQGMFDGFVRPSALMINKMEMLQHLHKWCGANALGDGEDRLFFGAIKHLSYGCTNKYTTNCIIDPLDGFHVVRMTSFNGQGPRPDATKTYSVRSSKNVLT